MESGYIEEREYGYEKEVVVVGRIGYEYVDGREGIVSELWGVWGIEGIWIWELVLS